METAIKNLENEHVYILRLLDVMQKMVNTISTDITHLEMVVSLINDYVDSFHHAKEEILLFPLMIKKAFANEQGPIKAMLHEHDDSRAFVKALKNEVRAFKKGDDSALIRLYISMQGYIDLIKEHINIEKNVLFRIANKTLSAEQQQDLLKEFEAAELVYSEGQIQKFINKIKGLEIAYNEVLIGDLI